MNKRQSWPPGGAEDNKNDLQTIVFRPAVAAMIVLLASRLTAQTPRWFGDEAFTFGW